MKMRSLYIISGLIALLATERAMGMEEHIDDYVRVNALHGSQVKNKVKKIEKMTTEERAKLEQEQAEKERLRTLTGNRYPKSGPRGEAPIGSGTNENIDGDSRRSDEEHQNDGEEYLDDRKEPEAPTETPPQLPLSLRSNRILAAIFGVSSAAGIITYLVAHRLLVPKEKRSQEDQGEWSI